MSNYGRVELHGYRFLILFLERPYSLATVFPGTPGSNSRCLCRTFATRVETKLEFDEYSPMSPELTVSVEDQVCQLLTPPDHILTPREYPLKDKLRTICEIVDSLRVNLLHTSMLVNFIHSLTYPILYI